MRAKRRAPTRELASPTLRGWSGVIVTDAPEPDARARDAASGSSGSDLDATGGPDDLIDGDESATNSWPVEDVG